MKYKFTIFTGALILATLLLQQQFIKTNTQASLTKNNQVQLLEDIREKIAQTDPDSDEAKKMNRLFTKVRKLKKGVFNIAENPAALLDAFNQIKKTPDGKTYSTNYKRAELNKAIAKKQTLQKQAAPLQWIERGPGNVSGRSRALLVDPDDASGNTWFVGTVGGGVWKTTDAGNTWVDKTPELTTLSTVCMAMAESNHDVIYVGTGMGYGRTVDLSGNGIWKSTDRGETWSNLESTANGELLPAINRIIVDPNDENILLVCSNGDYTSNGPNDGSRESGIFRSIDGGSNWTQVYNPETVFGSTRDNRVQQIIANPNNFNEIYGAVNEVGVIKSADGGLTWSTVADNFADPADIGFGQGTYQGISTRTELAIAPSDPTRIYASVERRRGISKLYMSKDSGQSWNEVIDMGNNPNWFSYNGADGANSYTGGWFDNTIVVNPYDEDIVFVGGIEIYQITVNPDNNTRQTNVVAPIGSIHVDHHYLVTIPVNEATNEFRILNANDGGVGISNNSGNTWTQIFGLGSTQFYGVDKAPGTNSYIGGLQDNGSWRSPANPNLNSNWFFAIGGDGFEAVWNYWDSNLLMGCSQGGSYRRSTNGGVTWSSVPDAKAGSAAPFVSKIAGSKADADMLFTVGISGVKRSDDFGASWILTPITNHWIGWRAFDNVEISIADPQVVWISSRMNFESFIGREGGIHLSRDGGLSFSEISDNFPLTVIEASGISTDPFDPATAYFLFSAVGNPKILRTTDYGQTFEDISGFGGLPKLAEAIVSSNGFPDVAVYQVLVMPYNTDIIWAGTEIGLFISEDNGISWSIADNGLPNVGIFQMSIVDDQVLVATYGRGIWTVTLPELASYIPPKVTLVPRLNPLAQNTSGDVEININLRSPYDSTLITINGEVAISLGENTSLTDTTLFYSVTESSSLAASVSAYHLGREYKTPSRSIDAEPIATLNAYSTDFNSLSSQNDFSGTSFRVINSEGFSNSALHSSHPYPDASEIITQLKNPIRVASENAIISFDEVVLIEEGVVNLYTDPNFFDYVIVEGSLDGLNWVPLLNGYDSRANRAWSNTYNSTISGQNSLAVGDESLYRGRTIDLLNNFNPGDVIFARFRIHADPLAFGWGWAIDNLSIQSDITDTSGEENLPAVFKLAQNYPNPFNPTTTIKYEIPNVASDFSLSNVMLKVYDILGKEVATLINTKQNPGYFEVEWNAAELTSGVYFYRLQYGDFVETKKMILMK
jgi:Secretion system C-terminal sorting domain